MSNVYIVQGYSGEYSDKYQWIDSAWLDRKKAESRAKELQDMYDKAKATAIKLLDDDFTEYCNFIEEFEEQHTYNPGRSYDAFVNVVDVVLFK